VCFSLLEWPSCSKHVDEDSKSFSGRDNSVVSYSLICGLVVLLTWLCSPSNLPIQRFTTSLTPMTLRIHFFHSFHGESQVPAPAHSEKDNHVRAMRSVQESTTSAITGRHEFALVFGMCGLFLNKRWNNCVLFSLSLVVIPRFFPVRPDDDNEIKCSSRIHYRAKRKSARFSL